jgi:transcriptional regulator GlxA family with amidase domain
VTSICAGSFALGSVGLLDGLRATTHWRHTAALARRFPTVTLDDEAIYVRDGRILTSAVVIAGIDLALALVEEDEGDEPAHRIGQDMVVFIHAGGGAVHGGVRQLGAAGGRHGAHPRRGEHRRRGPAQRSGQ